RARSADRRTRAPRPARGARGPRRRRRSRWARGPRPARRPGRTPRRERPARRRTGPRPRRRTPAGSRGAGSTDARQHPRRGSYRRGADGPRSRYDGAMTRRPASPTPDVARVLADNHARFLAFLTPRLGSPEAAEDVLQAAFVKGLEQQHALRDAESAVAWFYRLLRNAVIDHYRRRGAEERALPRAPEGAEPSVEDEPLHGEVCRCVHDLVPLLKPEY